MAEKSISVHGLSEATKAIYAYSQQLGDRVVRGSLRVGANYIARIARASAPVKTSALKRRGIIVRNSKIHRGKSSKDMIGVYLTIARKKKDDPYYGKFQEAGWRAGKRVMPGKLFIDKAFEQNKEKAAEAIQQSAIAASEVLKRKVGL
ncbi:phage protein, HK97 gp10 family [Nitrosospira multiformis]|uniref:Phage protein, HK97 gp10 family n=1 Tax=Nitrosospira multiformis TaxID=1231 RepID=A0A1H8IPG9_9PROT|nr:HK97-gp10 family putative phage morphogenesis protein [Nitrosospira multiformis]SEN70810.1 phage protein, HK97 gp10 family [Nitrosospira multiformis]